MSERINNKSLAHEMALAEDPYMTKYAEVAREYDECEKILDEIFAKVIVSPLEYGRDGSGFWKPGLDYKVCWAINIMSAKEVKREDIPAEGMEVTLTNAEKKIFLLREMMWLDDDADAASWEIEKKFNDSQL